MWRRRGNVWCRREPWDHRNPFLGVQAEVASTEILMEALPLAEASLRWRSEPPFSLMGELTTSGHVSTTDSTRMFESAWRNLGAQRNATPPK
jgi:hypothetical protein